MKKVMFISSTGGHFNELMQLKSMFKDYDYSVVTEKTNNSSNLKLEFKSRIHFLIFGSKDHKFTYPFKLLCNCFISLYLFIKIRPKYIISTGTHTAAPMCCLGKIFKSKIIYIETFANITKPTMTGRNVYKFADLFIIQWENLSKFYPNSIYGGSIF